MNRAVIDAECRAARRRQSELEMVCEGCMNRPDHDPLKDCSDCHVRTEWEETEKVIDRCERSAKKHER